MLYNDQQVSECNKFEKISSLTTFNSQTAMTILLSTMVECNAEVYWC